MSDHHGGDPTRHLPIEALDAALRGRARAPLSAGRVVALVTRQPGEGRAMHDALRLTVAGGAEGDRWTPDKHGTQNQITAMEAGVGELVANGQSLALFGDNLIVDLALDAENLPAGSRVRIGEDVLLEVTDKPHTGCYKYKARFGAAALQAISRKERASLRLRGIHFAVVGEGQVRVGDPVQVVSRP